MGGSKGSSSGRTPRSPKLWLALLAVAAAALVVFPGLSGATPNGLPVVTTGSATSVTNTTATLNGTVNPNDPDTTATYDYTFSWGTDQNNLGSSGGASISGGTSDQQVSLPISPLDANTQYYFQLCATNEADSTDTSCGAVVPFTTQDAPTPTTGAATSVGPSSATLSGSIVPNGATVSSAVFKYCTSCSDATTSSSSIAATLSGTNPVGATATLTGLSSGTTFHYALCATNTWGTRCDSTVQTFTTDRPPVASLSATSPTTGPVPLTVSFDGSASSDPDAGDAVQSYTFTFGDGSSVTQSSPTVSHTYSSPCSPCTASLTVTDKEGATSAASTVTIHANANQPPVATLTATPTPATGTVPLAVTFDGSQSHDPDGIALKSWSLDFGDGNSTSGTGAVSSSIAHTYSTAGTYHAVLTVTDSSNASTSSTSVTVTVNPQPTITVANVSQPEGNSGTTNFAFVVTLSAKSTHDVTVDYATADGTATAGSDYTSTSGTLTIPAGTDCTTSPGTNPACQIVVPVSGDTLYENDETFALNLANPTGATLVNSSATGTILNDDPKPVLMIEDNGVSEGNAGSIVAGAQTWASGGNLQLQDASGFPNTPGDTFVVTTPHSTSVTTFTYSGVSGNTLTGVTPGGSVTASQIASQPVALPLTVLLCDPTKMPVNSTSVNDCLGKAQTTSGLDTTVPYVTKDGQSLTTAIPVVMGQDYLYSSGTLTIPAGATSGQIVVYVIPNTTPENPSNPLYDLDRWFSVNLDKVAVANAKVAWGLGTAHILDDDGPNKPTATTGPASAIGTTTATVSGTANGEGPATTVWVEYGTTDSYGSSTPTQAIAAGTSGDQSFSFALTGLTPGTPYHYRLVAAHSQADGGAVAYGKDMTFPTDRAPVAKLTASPTSGPVKLNVTFDGSGSSDPDGSIASWVLAFGDGTSKTGTGPVPSAITHTYTSPCSCTAALTVTDNQGAQSAAAKVTIKASAATAGGPTLSKAAATAIATSAKIGVTVDSKGAPSQVWISYGTSTKYGLTSQAQRIQSGATRRLTFLLTGLSPNTSYHYQIVGWHTAVDSGTTYSNDMALSTPGPGRMLLALRKQLLRVTATGDVLLPFYCGGTLLWSCKGQVQLALGNRVVASKSFTVPRLQRRLISLRLKAALLQRLLRSHSLRLDLMITVRTGRGGDLTIKQITLLPPLKAKSKR